MKIKILGIGDIVGRPGREAVRDCLPGLVAREGVGFCVGNAENVAGGSGLTPDLAEKLIASGLHVLTNGDHVWRKREIYEALERDARLLRPANYGAGVPGRGWNVYETAAGPVGVLNLLGQTFMEPVECPFKTADRAVTEMSSRTKMIVVDIHGEATSDKIALGRYLDGRVSLIFGSHTHVQTADEQIFPKGTAFITDCGMTGPYDSVIGRRVEDVLAKYLSRLPHVLEVATGDPRMCGVIAEVDTRTGLASSIRRFQEKPAA